MRDAGVTGCVVNATREEDWEAVRALAQDFPDFVRPAYGIHPWFANTPKVGWQDRLREILIHDPSASVDEIGVDGWVSEPKMEIQQPVFREQIKIAVELDRPVTIHCLKAWGIFFPGESPYKNLLMAWDHASNANIYINMRKLTPELLDHLPHNDPGARRSRRDLRRINFFMGNERWIMSMIPNTGQSITEIGAGDGHLLSRIATQHPDSAIVAYDLAPRPLRLPAKADWKQGDLFSQPPPQSGGTLIANLFLHHFDEPQLHELGKWMGAFDTLIINEPLRAGFPLLMAKLAAPFIHPITRHDMRVSIEAGFVTGELADLLDVKEKGFNIIETTDWRGGIRLYCTKLK